MVRGLPDRRLFRAHIRYGTPQIHVFVDCGTARIGVIVFGCRRTFRRRHGLLLRRHASSSTPIRGRGTIRFGTFIFNYGAAKSELSIGNALFGFSAITSTGCALTRCLDSLSRLLRKEVNGAERVNGAARTSTPSLLRVSISSLRRASDVMTMRGIASGPMVPNPPTGRLALLQWNMG